METYTQTYRKREKEIGGYIDILYIRIEQERWRREEYRKTAGRHDVGIRTFPQLLYPL